MEEKATIIESLIEKSEAYAKTSLDLFKLKAIDTTADVVSTIVSKVAVIIGVLLIILLLSIGLSIWLGELIGTLYHGFFIVAAFYVFVTLILHYRPGLIKFPINDFIILKMLNKEKDEKKFTQ